MSVIATVAVPAASFPLGSIVDPDADDTVTVETTVPTSEGIIPYLWVPSSISSSVVDTLESNSSVASVTTVDELDDSVLLKLEWDGRVNGLFEAIRRHETIVISAVGTADRWTLRARFPTSADLSAFYSECLERDVPIELVQLHEAVSPALERRFGLTRPQRDLIVEAYELGYFDVPRTTTLVELGDRLDVSDSAVSQRLRRGLTTLIESTLTLETASVTDPDASESATGTDR
ncbi:helix-turn-helix domain-containing protein [Natrarchaeobaculum sulfurireducens]|uniref:Bacterio-opsin activator domain-containingprotein n=1 Tax=Natrarchaeobaculum sulfurireducens TaxID=2044521 RepID=A0A346PRQ8_9EURY|nr:bacterio-opsin activator domain-containing protein [Natrarchaeobaculum sulfurireducens]AXR82203.1 Bacterio-opsin activator domain-containingprotein [Natrarchaeobaculum sulfurireducens]